MTGEALILAHDLGTSSDKAALVTARGEVVAVAVEKVATSFPRPTWAEQDPADWWRAVAATTRRVLEEGGARPAKVRALAFSSQMLGVVAVDGDGTVLRPAIIWLDSRAGDVAKRLARGGWPRVRLHGVKVSLRKLARWLRITGGGPSPVGKDPPWKLAWLREHEPDVWAATHKVLDCKDYLVHACTGVFVTSRDAANLTWAFDNRPGRMRWSPTLLKMLDLPLEKLPEVHASTDVVGGLLEGAAGELGLVAGTPVVCGCGDVAAAAVGSGAVREKATHVYVGTSGWVVAPLRKRTLHLGSFTGSICGADPDKYNFVAEKEVAGEAFEWFLRVAGSGERVVATTPGGGATPLELLDEEAAKSPPGAGGVMFFPWLFGERAPVDDDALRGAFFNLSLDDRHEHLARAVYEGVALNFRWGFAGFEAKRVNLPGDAVNAIGGGVKSNVFCQILADATGRTIRRVVDPQHAGARGTALVAAVGLGTYPDFDSLAPLFEFEATFEPNPRARRLYDVLFGHFLRFHAATKPLYRQVHLDRDLFAR
ncbi:MAG: FGGY-family carbohydrate kinase [Promethearchaeota archaeon]